jgi:hypothetical protein
MKRPSGNHGRPSFGAGASVSRSRPEEAGAHAGFEVMRFPEMGLPAVSPYGWSVSEQADSIASLAKGAICLPDAGKRDSFEQSAFLLAKRMWVQCPKMPEASRTLND